MKEWKYSESTDLSKREDDWAWEVMRIDAEFGSWNRGDRLNWG
jgi:hypothetical protein